MCWKCRFCRCSLRRTINIGCILTWARPQFAAADLKKPLKSKGPPQQKSFNACLTVACCCWKWPVGVLRLNHIEEMKNMKNILWVSLRANVALRSKQHYIRLKADMVYIAYVTQVSGLCSAALLHSRDAVPVLAPYNHSSCSYRPSIPTVHVPARLGTHSWATCQDVINHPHKLNWPHWMSLMQLQTTFNFKRLFSTYSETVVCVFQGCLYKTNIYGLFWTHRSRIQIQIDSVGTEDLGDSSFDVEDLNDSPHNAELKVASFLLKLEHIYLVSSAAVDELLQEFWVPLIHQTIAQHTEW